MNTTWSPGSYNHIQYDTGTYIAAQPGTWIRGTEGSHFGVRLWNRTDRRNVDFGFRLAGGLYE